MVYLLNSSAFFSFEWIFSTYGGDKYTIGAIYFMSMNAAMTPSWERDEMLESVIRDFFSLIYSRCLYERSLGITLRYVTRCD